MRGQNVFIGYWDDPDATARVLVDGWLRTGDVAVADDDGYLSLVDRKKDLVIVSGFNVFPAEVEDVLLEHPDIADAAVIGVPNRRTGEAVAAWVVVEPGASLTAEQVRDHTAHKLARVQDPGDGDVRRRAAAQRSRQAPSPRAARPRRELTPSAVGDVRGDGAARAPAPDATRNPK